MRLLTLLFFALLALAPQKSVAHPHPVHLGVDVFFEKQIYQQLKGKGVGLVTNHTGVNSQLRSTIELFKEHSKNYKLVALFAPEHGLSGGAHADHPIENQKDRDGVPIYSLYGATRAPTAAMLKGIDVLIFDIQDIGSRSYTYPSTLFYVMEEAAKSHIKVIVLDRPNPINGVTVDGPMLDPKWRSFVGYINVPFCHGMTIGELALFFNGEYRIGCDLEVIPMSGWQREMTFVDTELPWVPTSPQIPDAQTPQYLPMTSLIGDILNVSIGVGYTLPFKVVGAPWIDAERLAQALNGQHFAGVTFQPFHFQPFFSRYKGEACHGVRILVTDVTHYRPVATQFLILGILKNLYPNEFAKELKWPNANASLLYKIFGSEEPLRIIREEKYIAWKLISLDKKEREAFLKQRKPYLLY